MGKPKPLIEWFGTTLLEYQLESLLAGGTENIVAVTGAYDEYTAPLLEKPNVRRTYNPDFAQGKATSIKVGALALPEQAHTIILLGVDQPRPYTLIRYIIECHEKTGALITAPYCSVGGGHPLVFDGTLRNEIASVKDETKGVREVLKRYSEKVYKLHLETVLIRMDINTPEDCRAALKNYQRLVQEMPI